MRHGLYTLGLALILGASASHQAQAQLVITPTFDSTWSGDANAVTDEGIIISLLTNTYDARYTNPITVTIDFSDVNFGLGTSTTTQYSGLSYSTYRTVLTNDKQTIHGGDGNTAFLSNLPAGSNPVPGNSTSGVSVSSAQGRSLGFNTPGIVTVTGQTGKIFDAQIQLNVGLTGPGAYSLQSVASHEINEVLGVFTNLNGRGDIAGTASLSNVGPMDFFRYSAPGVRSFTSDSHAKSYFSVDGGTTPIVYFNQQTGADYQDWASSGNAIDGAGVDSAPQVQDAFGTPGSNPVLGPSEFAALNVIGYNLKPQGTPAPEPTALVSMSAGSFGLLGLGLNARRRRSKSAA